MGGSITRERGRGKRKRRRICAREERQQTRTECEANENGPDGNIQTTPKRTMTSGVEQRGEGILTTALTEGGGE